MDLSLLGGLLGKQRTAGVPNMSALPQFGNQEQSAGIPPPPEQAQAQPPIEQGDVKESRWDKWKALLPAAGGLIAGAVAPDSDMVSGFLKSQIGQLDNERKRRQEREDNTHKLSLEVLNRQYSEETLRKHPELASAKQKAAQLVVQGKPIPSKTYSELVLNDALAASDEKKYLDEKAKRDREDNFKQQRDMQREAELADYKFAEQVMKNPEQYPEGSPEWYQAQMTLGRFRRTQPVEVKREDGGSSFVDPKEALREETRRRGQDKSESVADKRAKATVEAAKIRASKVGQPKPTQLTEGQKDKEYSAYLAKVVSNFGKPMSKEDYFRQMGWDRGTIMPPPGENVSRAPRDQPPGAKLPPGFVLSR